MSKETLGSILKQRRLDSGLSLRKLGEEVGLCHVTIMDIETGKNKQPSFQKIVVLAKRFHLRLDALGRCV